MKRTLLLVLLVIVPAIAEKDPPRIESLAFLAGSWKGDMGGGQFIAYYSTPQGGKVLSFSRVLAGTKTVFYEFETFESRAGVLFATPYPGGKRAPSFRLFSLEGEKAVFDNPKKDFPTRIAYHLVAKDNLVITLTDPHGKSTKVQTFDLKRAK